MKRLALRSTMALLVCAAGAAAAAGQDSVQTVKDLYAAAAYEDALAAVDRLQRDKPQHEVEQYRVLTLTALGRTEEAQKAMEAMIEADPSYVLDPVETPPRVQEAFVRVRQRMLPVVTKQLYADARAALERKDRESAIGKFEKLLKIIDSAGPAKESMADMRVLADGFLGLSKALPTGAPAPASGGSAVSAPVPTPGPSPAAAAPATPGTPGAGRPAAGRPAAAGVETRPVAISQSLPTWFPSDSLSRRSAFSGSVKVSIGTDGRVSGAEIVESVHPTYDPMLLRAARDWLYQPAKRNDVPVASELIVEVNLRPR
jgi:outer membrane biosynthesis protein TonB